MSRNVSISPGFNSFALGIADKQLECIGTDLDRVLCQSGVSFGN